MTERKRVTWAEYDADPAAVMKAAERAPVEVTDGDDTTAMVLDCAPLRADDDVREAYLRGVRDGIDGMMAFFGREEVDVTGTYEDSTSFHEHAGACRLCGGFYDSPGEYCEHAWCKGIAAGLLAFLLWAKAGRGE